MEEAAENGKESSHSEQPTDLIIRYNTRNKIIITYFNCKGMASTSSSFLLSNIVALSDEGCNYQLKHVVVNVMNK
jgi:hypothetical protein